MVIVDKLNCSLLTNSDSFSMVVKSLLALDSLLVLIHVEMNKEDERTHWWANFSLKTRLSWLTSISLIREKGEGEKDTYYQKADLVIQKGSQIPIIYSSPHCPGALVSGEKEMTQEISIHHVQAHWMAGAQEGADPTVLPRPCTYILSSSSCLIG